MLLLYYLAVPVSKCKLKWPASTDNCPQRYFSTGHLLAQRPSRQN